MKLLFVIYSLAESGGAERVLCLLTNELANRGHEITVLTLVQGPTFYPLDSRVRHLDLSDAPRENASTRSRTIFAIFKRNFGRLKRLRKMILGLHVDAVISFMDYSNTLCSMALLGTKVKLIGSEHNDPRFLRLTKLANFMRRIAYRRLDCLLSCSQGVDHEFSWLPQSQRMVMYNPLTPSSPPYPRPPFMDSSKKWILATGRLTEQKGFDRLIEMFATLAHDFPEWQLLILGEGEQRNKLEALILRHKLKERVLLYGRVKDVFPCYHAADIFTLSSRSEGFPMVLLEAMSSGLPVISFDCPSGPSEILRSEEDGGVLIPNNDIQAFTNAMRRLMSNSHERKIFSERIAQSVRRFELNSVVCDWERLINKILLPSSPL